MNFLVKEGAVEGVEKFIDGSNPFVARVGTGVSDVPPWTWLTALSAGFVSMLMLSSSAC